MLQIPCGRGWTRKLKSISKFCYKDYSRNSVRFFWNFLRNNSWNASQDLSKSIHIFYVIFLGILIFFRRCFRIPFNLFFIIPRVSRGNSTEIYSEFCIRISRGLTRRSCCGISFEFLLGFLLRVPWQKSRRFSQHFSQCCYRNYSWDFLLEILQGCLNSRT